MTQKRRIRESILETAQPRPRVATFFLSCHGRRSDEVAFLPVAEAVRGPETFGGGAAAGVEEVGQARRPGHRFRPAGGHGRRQEEDGVAHHRRAGTFAPLRVSIDHVSKIVVKKAKLLVPKAFMLFRICF